MKTVALRIFGTVLLILLILALMVSAGRIFASSIETVNIVRDAWGIPHIFASTSKGAFFGLGYATAEDRMFQMEYSRRIVQGRIAELIGERGIASDELWRTIGWYKNAQETAEKLDFQISQLLQAYAEGVNHYLKERNKEVLYLFAEYGINPDPWTVADSIACWYRLSFRFSGINTAEVANLHTFESLVEQVGFEEATNQLFRPSIVDETGAIVQPQDMDAELIAEIEEYAKTHGFDSDLSALALSEESFPKASHAWVVGGNRTTTGSAILHSDPQIAVSAPSVWYEFHICGGEFDARGIGVAGAPGMLIGWNKNIAWGATAAGGDLADLFKLEINPDNQNQYRYDGSYRNMEVADEEITLRNGIRIPVRYRNTIWGPVVTSLLSNVRRGEEFAMKHVEVHNSTLCSLKSMIEVMKADDWESFENALENYLSPAIHFIYGDRNGNIGYQMLSGIPLRSAEFPFFGKIAQPGNSSNYDWQEIIPKRYLPHTFNPQCGAISTANNMAVGSWYPLPVSFGTGDTIRSWRLRERLSMLSEFSQNDVLSIHSDAVNPAIREMVRLARHIVYVLNQSLSDQALNALSSLESWNGEFNTSQTVYPLIDNFNLMFRTQTTSLASTYGGGEAGLCNFAKKVKNDLDTNSEYIPTDEEKNYVDSLLGNAWLETVKEYGDVQSQWIENYDKTIYVKYQNNLENFGSLDLTEDFHSPAMMCKHTATILSQHGNSYSQNVRFDNLDLSKSVIPPGVSENPNSQFFDDQTPIWAAGELHEAPLTRELIEDEASSKRSIYYPPTSTATPTPSPTSMPPLLPVPTPVIPTPTPSPTASTSPTPNVTAIRLPTEVICATAIIVAAAIGIVVIRKRKKDG